jgi:hypothetical protein
MIGPMKASLLLAVVAAGLSVGYAAAAAPAPRLLLVDRTPLTVAGRGFEADAAVHVRVSFGRTQLTKTTTSSGRGAFTARWQRSAGDSSCTQMTVVATSAHRRATLKIVPQGLACGTERISGDPAPSRP